MIEFWGRHFKPYILEEELLKRSSELGKKISEDFQGRSPIILSVLNGAFMFTSDLVKHIDLKCEIHFMRYKSYDGMASTGEVKNVYGLPVDVENRPVIVVEDIVDTGSTLNQIIKDLLAAGAESVQICTLLHKPEATTFDLHLDYVGFEIPNRFVLGYGLDYDGLGRNLKDLYQEEKDQ